MSGMSDVQDRGWVVEWEVFVSCGLRAIQAFLICTSIGEGDNDKKIWGIRLGKARKREKYPLRRVRPGCYSLVPKLNVESEVLGGTWISVVQKGTVLPARGTLRFDHP